MSSTIFLYPEYFLLLLPLFLGLFFLYKWNNKKYVFQFFSDLKKIYGHNSMYIKIYYLIILFILILFVTIFSNLISQTEKQNIAKNGIDINIVLDVSYSMLATDLQPNRLKVSKSIIWDFTQKLKTDRLGLTVFAGKPFVSLPLNFDYNITNKIISKVSVDTINQRYSRMQGTAVWDALVLAGESFDTDDEREKVIILLTDWEANKGLDPIIATEYLLNTFKKRLKIYTIGIWWLDKAYIELPDGFWWINKIEVWWVDETSLKTIAEKGDWKYFRATDSESLKDIFEMIAKLEKKEIEVDSFVTQKEKNIYFIYVLIFLFLSLFSLVIRKNM